MEFKANISKKKATEIASKIQLSLWRKDNNPDKVGDSIMHQISDRDFVVVYSTTGRSIKFVRLARGNRHVLHIDYLEGIIEIKHFGANLNINFSDIVDEIYQ